MPGTSHYGAVVAKDHGVCPNTHLRKAATGAARYVTIRERRSAGATASSASPRLQGAGQIASPSTTNKRCRPSRNLHCHNLPCFDCIWYALLNPETSGSSGERQLTFYLTHQADTWGIAHLISVITLPTRYLDSHVHCHPTAAIVLLPITPSNTQATSLRFTLGL